MTEEKKTPYIKLYKEAAAAILKRCGVAALGCFAALARKADYSGGWALEISLRDLAEYLGVSLNTVKKSLLQPLEREGFINMDSPDKVKTRIVLSAMADIESGKGLKSVSNFDTDEKNKNQSVSKFDTDLAALFPDFVVQVGPGSVKTVSNFDAGTEEKNQTVSNFDTAQGTENAQNGQSVSKFDTDSGAQTVSNSDTAGKNPFPSTPPYPNIYIFNKQEGAKAKPQKEKNAAPCTLEEVKQFFAEKKFIADPEYFFYKNEANDWKRFCKRKNSFVKITRWKGTAYVFEQYNKQNGAVSWNDPKEPGEKLFKWYYEAAMPDSFNNAEARASRWNAERGNCAHIICVARTFERAQKLVEYGAEKLEKGNYTPSLKAIANNAFGYDAEIQKAGLYGGCDDVER